jgi:outer membrane immunogenic protein
MFRSDKFWSIEMTFVASLRKTGFVVALLMAGSTVSAQAQVQNWTGLYGGVHGGLGAGNVNSGSANGGLVGGQVGFNAQADRIVIGVEGDITSSAFEHRGLNGGGQTFKQKWMGTARGRVGHAFDQVLLYGTAGVAAASNELRDPAAKISKNTIGWVAGAGAEAKLTDRISVRGEILHYAMGISNYTTPLATYKADTRTNVLRAGVNYRF